MRANTKVWLLVWFLGSLLAGAFGCSTSATSAASDAGPISDPIAYCKTAMDLVCARAYECVPLAARDVDFMMSYAGAVADCKTKLEATCVDAAANCPNYNPAMAGACVASLTNDACADLLSTNQIVEPDSCSTACGI